MKLKFLDTGGKASPSRSMMESGTGPELSR
jgi:hypothetical protein